MRGERECVEILLPTGEGAPDGADEGGRQQRAASTKAEIMDRSFGTRPRADIVDMAASLTPALSRRERECFKILLTTGEGAPDGADEGGRQQRAASTKAEIMDRSFRTRPRCRHRGYGSFPHPDPLPEGEGGVSKRNFKVCI
jgi:hypothetical protein